MMKVLVDKKNLRLFYAAIALSSTILLAVAYYLEHMMGLEPCPLCITQRVCVFFIGGVSLAALLSPLRRGWVRVYHSLAIIFAVLGGAVAARQVWLQHLPTDQVPPCGPGLGYMLEVLPWDQVLTALLRGDGNCADVTWVWWGLSIPEWTLIGFIGVALLYSYLWVIAPIAIGEKR